MCVRCGAEPEDRHANCASCRALARAYMTKMRDVAIGSGRCTNCMRRPAEPGIRRCRWCIARHVGYVTLGDSTRVDELLALYEAQRGRCAVTGLPIEIGVTASLDHVVPRSRGGTHDPNNLRWVLKVVNLAKHAMTDDEFFRLCRHVARLHPE